MHVASWYVDHLVSNRHDIVPMTLRRSLGSAIAFLDQRTEKSRSVVHIRARLCSCVRFQDRLEKHRNNFGQPSKRITRHPTNCRCLPCPPLPLPSTVVATDFLQPEQGLPWRLSSPFLPISTLAIRVVISVPAFVAKISCNCRNTCRYRNE